MLFNFLELSTLLYMPNKDHFGPHVDMIEFVSMQHFLLFFRIYELNIPNYIIIHSAYVLHVLTPVFFMWITEFFSLSLVHLWLLWTYCIYFKVFCSLRNFNCFNWSTIFYNIAWITSRNNFIFGFDTGILEFIEKIIDVCFFIHL